MTVKKLIEMAHNIGSSYSRLDSYPGAKEIAFKISKKDPIVEDHSYLKLHKHEYDTGVKYNLNNHKTGQTLYSSTFLKKHSDEHLPFHAEEQLIVNNSKDGIRGYATDHAYKHFNQSRHPLASSTEQYSGGHKMWRRLVDKALTDGHHVYHWGGKQLHKTTNENKAAHLKASFGKSAAYTLKHMVISKNPLLND